MNNGQSKCRPLRLSTDLTAVTGLPDRICRAMNLDDDMQSNLQALRCRLRDELRETFGVELATARLVFAPYRICPLGAHIDHQLGPVTAMALDRGVLLAYAPVASRQVRLRSLEFPNEVRFDLAAPGPARPADWGNYARGAATVLARSGYALERGLVGIISGPWNESGLSSSAAVGVAYLLAFEEVNKLQVSAGENIALDQALETGYMGLRNGILDQSGILLSRQDHLTRIDCATAESRLIPAPRSLPPWNVLLAFSGLKRALVGTDYNRRVAECEAAVRILLAAAGRRDENPCLGRLGSKEYLEHRDRLPEPLRRRAAHFFAEVERVQRGCQVWAQGDLWEFGRLMTASGESSIRNYECGSPPLIGLYEIMTRCEGVYGARFSGAGFRGCCVGLVEQAAAAQAAETIQRAYAERYPELAPAAWMAVGDTGDGARVLRDYP